MSSNPVNTLRATSSGLNGTGSPTSGDAASPVSEADDRARPAENVVVVEETPRSTSITDPARRRRHRRRRRSVKNERTERRLRFFLLVTVGLLIFVAAGRTQLRGVGKGFIDTIRPYIPVSTIKSLMSYEVIALVLAALILLYLMPGVEDRVLRALGLKKERRSRSSHR
jgi:hypothetical protein